MGNIISFDGTISIDDDSLSMSNGLTDVFIDYLLICGSQLAESESEKRMTVFLAEKQQTIIGMGTVGFDIIEMPWQIDSFEAEKDDPINCGFPKCSKHGVLLSLFGCKLCNDGA